MLKSLLKDTVIYGLSSIVGRFLNYLLVPLYTAKIAAASGGYGVISEVYSYVALMLVLLTFGMETAFFRFVNKEHENPMRVYNTTLSAVGIVGVSFVALVLLFLSPISDLLNYAQHPEYIAMMAVCVAIDAFQCILFAYLRYQKKAIKFASLKLLFIVLNILGNVLYFVVLPQFMSFTIDVGAVFAINVLCTTLITFCFYKELRGFRFQLDSQLLRQMLKYSWPILVLGIAGILNQTADKMLYCHLVEGEAGKVQLGIYSACVKIAMIMAMITQAFRYAYEPIVFGRGGTQDMGKAMKFFLIFTLFAFTIVIAYLDLFKYIIAPDYWEGLQVVPIVMVAEIMMGVYFNLSFWYKLIDKTIWGAWFSGAGCLVLIGVNVVFVPIYGFMACAWAGVAGYGIAMLLSYFFGQKYYPITYPLKQIAVYVAITILFYVVMQVTPHFVEHAWLQLGINTCCVLAFAGHIGYHEFIKRKI
ncbi:MAG: lipopolysaccharide biosynthesis protein [Bacteroidaceae bacterium]|nr:lipopolysaccharide biosynthesis protein [Bacteroidaceae bacterium]